MHIDEPRHPFRHRLRRPSPPAFVVAGLLAADLLRRFEAWTDATFSRRRARVLCDPNLTRPAPREGMLRYRVFLFLVVVLALVTLPALFARAVAS